MIPFTPLLPFFRWCDGSMVAKMIRGNTYTFPLLEVIHLWMLTMLLGAIALMDMRLLGWGLKRESVSQVSGWMSPWLWTGLVGTVATGSLLFTSEALKCYVSVPFYWKIGFLVLAILFYTTIHKRVRQSEDSSPAVRKATALCSMFLWFGIGFAGRAIAFY